MNRKEFEQKVRERNTDEVLTKEEVVGYVEKVGELEEELEQYKKEGRMNIVLKSNRVLDEFLEYYHKNYENLSSYFKKTFPKSEAEKDWTVRDASLYGTEAVELTIFRQDGYNHIERKLLLPTGIFYDKDYYYTDEGMRQLNLRQIIGDWT